MVHATWLNEAIGSLVACQDMQTYMVDTSELLAMATATYRVKPTLTESTRQAQTLLFPLLVNQNHWVLAIMQRSGRFMAPPDLYDSLPAATTVPGVQDTLRAFCRHYMPQELNNVDYLVECGTPLQQNGVDCGVFAFASCIHALIGRPLPVRLSMPIWRRALATVVGVEEVDWTSLVPGLPQTTTLAADADAVPTPSTGNPLQMYSNILNTAKARFNALKSRLAQELDQAIQLTSSTLGDVVAAHRIFQSLETMSAHKAAVLQQQLHEATTMGSLVVQGTKSPHHAAQGQIQRSYESVERARVRLMTITQRLRELNTTLQGQKQDLLSERKAFEQREVEAQGS
ncbi:hypothetical protein Ct61P_15085 [Colletotrichum tofieldiae]|nr:hypothetical protein Ct61P_15085 [Colletotrichum tofieldiae]